MDIDSISERQAYRIVKFLASKHRLSIKMKKFSYAAIPIFYDPQYSFHTSQSYGIWWNNALLSYNETPSWKNVLKDMLLACKKHNVEFCNGEIILNRGANLEQILIEMELKTSVQ